MTLLPALLRAIADRLEAAEAAVLDVQTDLWQIAGQLPGEVVGLAAMRDGSSIEPDSASVQVADGDQAGAPAGAATAGSSGSPAPPIHAGGEVVSVEDATSPSAIEQATPADRRAPPTAVRRQPTVSPASPGPAFDPLGTKPSARSLLSKRDRQALSPTRPGERRTCPKCEKDWPPQGFMTHVRWCSSTATARA